MRAHTAQARVTVSTRMIPEDIAKFRDVARHNGYSIQGAIDEALRQWSERMMQTDEYRQNLAVYIQAMDASQEARKITENWTQADWDGYADQQAQRLEEKRKVS